MLLASKTSDDSNLNKDIHYGEGMQLHKYDSTSRHSIPFDFRCFWFNLHSWILGDAYLSESNMTKSDTFWYAHLRWMKSITCLKWNEQKILDLCAMVKIYFEFIFRSNAISEKKSLFRTTKTFIDLKTKTKQSDSLKITIQLRFLLDSQKIQI